MKIGELEQRCGECNIIEFCGNPFGYCICNKERFEDVDTETYKKYADQAETTQFALCTDCANDCDDCESEDDAKDYYCDQVSEYVANKILN